MNKSAMKTNVQVSFNALHIHVVWNWCTQNVDSFVHLVKKLLSCLVLEQLVGVRATFSNPLSLKYYFIYTFVVWNAISKNSIDVYLHCFALFLVVCSVRQYKENGECVTPQKIINVSYKSFSVLSTGVISILLGTGVPAKIGQILKRSKAPLKITRHWLKTFGMNSMFFFRGL